MEQYLSRLPKGIIPNLSGLIRELQEQKNALASELGTAETAMPLDGDKLAEGLSPQARQIWQSMSDEVRRAALAAVM